MTKPLVSIVIPVFNKEIYLKQCINSVLQQKYKNIEVILVDDGSTDESPDMCDQFAKSDNRFIVVHKPNGGHSEARNTGIRHAKGVYIMFLDSDDYLCDDFAISSMVDIAIENDNDIVISDFLHLFDKKKHNFQNQNGIQSLIWMIENNAYHATMCSRLIKLDLILNNELFFEKLICDDELWTPKLFYFADSVGVYNNVIYSRRVLTTSVTGIVSEDNYYKKAIDRIYTSKKLLSFFENKINSNVLYTHILSFYVSAFPFLQKLEKEENIRNVMILLKNDMDILKYSKFSNNSNHKKISLLMKFFGVKNTSKIIFKYIKTR